LVELTILDFKELSEFWGGFGLNLFPLRLVTLVNFWLFGKN